MDGTAMFSLHLVVTDNTFVLHAKKTNKTSQLTIATRLDHGNFQHLLNNQDGQARTEYRNTARSYIREMIFPHLKGSSKRLTI